jgi:uncharacterized oligopeptide transporter (OPT) family protein
MMYNCTAPSFVFVVSAVCIVVVVVVSLCSSTVSSFTATSSQSTTKTGRWGSYTTNEMYMTIQIGDNNNVDDTVTSQLQQPSPKQQQVQLLQSQAIPFMKVSPTLAAFPNVPGNVGFDPLGFVQDNDDYIAYQEAEIKHARLAMLVRLKLQIDFFRVVQHYIPTISQKQNL